MPAQRVPDDDLYARLRVPTTATADAIEIAWRTLLKRHHPDIAGDAGLDSTKRINIAHDWLSDSDLRARYDRERGIARRVGRSRGPAADEGLRWTRSARPRDAPAPPPPARPTVTDPAAILARFIDRAGRLSDDELDRLGLAEPHAIAFTASLDRILPAERRTALEATERRLAARVPAAVWARLPVRDAILAVALELVVGAFLDEHVPDPTRARIRERLLRGWEAAVDQPRYGPNTPIVERVRERAARLTPVEAAALVDADAAADVADGRAPRSNPRADADPPWPFGDDPSDDEALRVSAALAARDIAASPGQAAFAGLDAESAAEARRILGRIGHAVALRHGFDVREFAALVAPWRAATGDPLTGRSPIERPQPSVRRSA